MNNYTIMSFKLFLLLALLQMSLIPILLSPTSTQTLPPLSLALTTLFVSQA